MSKNQQSILNPTSSCRVREARQLSLALVGSGCVLLRPLALCICPHCVDTLKMNVTVKFWYSFEQYCDIFVSVTIDL